MVQLITTYGQLLLTAMGQTLLLALCGLFFGCILGIIFGLASVVDNKFTKIIFVHSNKFGKGFKFYFFKKMQFNIMLN